MRYNAKKTLGIGGPVFVSNAANTPGETTYDTFVASASDGEIAIFTSAGAKKTDALAAGDELFIAQKVGGRIKKTPVFTYVSAQHKDYVAGTKQKVIISAPAALAANAEVMISVTETTMWSHPLPVWEYSKVVASANDFYGTFSALVDEINNVNAVSNDSNGMFLLAKLHNAGTASEFDADATFTKGSKTVSFAGGVNTHGSGTAPVAGDLVQVLGVIYKIATVGATNITLDRAYAGDTVTIDVSAVTGDASANVIPIANIDDYSISLESLEYDVTFNVAATVDTAGVLSTLSKSVTPFVKSVGRPENVAQWELEGQVWEGYRTGNTAFAEDFGKPESQVSSANTYQVFVIKYENSQKSVAAPIEKDYHIGYINVFLLNSSTQWDTQFGL